MNFNIKNLQIKEKEPRAERHTASRTKQRRVLATDKLNGCVGRQSHALGFRVPVFEGHASESIGTLHETWAAKQRGQLVHVL